MDVEFQDKKIHVEVQGEGEPLVLLNGIMMSPKSWAPFVGALSKNHKLILLDFLDQGQSSKMDEPFSITLQAEVVDRVLDVLDIPSAYVAGISYGSSVALHVATKYPNRVKKLLLFNGVPYTSPWLRDIGEGWKEASATPEGYYAVTIPVIYSADFYNREREWIEKRKELLLKTAFRDTVFLRAMDRLIDSSVHHDVRNELSNISVPTLVVSSRDDFLTPVSEQAYMAAKIPDAQHIIIEDCGHASMYEKPAAFLTLLLGFIETDVSSIVI